MQRHIQDRGLCIGGSQIFRQHIYITVPVFSYGEQLLTRNPAYLVQEFPIERPRNVLCRIQTETVDTGGIYIPYGPADEFLIHLTVA